MERRNGGRGGGVVVEERSWGEGLDRLEIFRELLIIGTLMQYGL